MGVHAHPDDESLSTGGLLAAWAAGGRPVCVVTCTRGERGEVIALPGTTSEGRAGLEGDGPALGAYRETELAAALTALGDGPDGIEHAFLDRLSGPDGERHPGYEDSGMAWVAPGVAGPAPDSPPTAFARVALDEPAGRLAVLLRERRPAVVATYEPGGGYGHPDHVRTHAVTVRALELAADPAWRPGGTGRAGEPWAGAELWQAVAPASVVRAARATLAGLPDARALAAAHGLTFPDPDEDLPPFAVEDLDVAEVVRVDVRPVLDRVVGALRAHATQVQHATALPRPDGEVAGWYALSNGVLAPILATETYRVSAPGGRRARSPWR
ncbi:1D-myo-inositol 2-acetamido-2-deoxy-alpha-D-glucopyranoside deacetylase [Promicromonospora citrea]|uniref:1D-myo-inositol 2-acetamido-2-deoxy-alpha-D-glucopyranoside deacetylase n=1 Tax=Promicromonospora citrea TaxID=43677 RepID=A0A8H9L4I4_9MICO|nr:1D-myo-inositol 2-acetamido-2-deoxy-alpha-D-glucopyranoside deacetylase [Promicromonospora citrea]